LSTEKADDRHKETVAEGGAGDKGHLSTEKTDDKHKETVAGKRRPISVRFCRKEIFNKLKDMTVLVDNFNDPLKVYFVNGNDGLVESKKHPDTFRPVDIESKFVIVDRLILTSSDITEENLNEDGKSAMELLETLSSLEYKRIGGQNKWESAITENELQNNFLEKTKGNMRDKEAMMLIFMMGEFFDAFERGMTNGAGKNALTALINMSLRVHFGREYFCANVRCSFMVGGCDKTEMLPVKETPPSFRPQRTRAASESPSVPPMSPGERIDKWDLNSGLPGYESSVSSVVSSTSSVRYVKIDHKGVFADALAVSGCKPNWPHFLFVGEVKCVGEEPGDFSALAKAQLKREMLATLLHQSMVYGILIGNTQCLLARMKLDFETGEINYCISKYRFVSEKRKKAPEKRQFCVSEIKRLFLDLLNALDDLQENVEEACHLRCPDANE